MEPQLLDAAMAALRNQGLDAEITAREAPLRMPPLRADAIVRIGIDGRWNEFIVEGKRRLTPAMLGAAIAQLGQIKAQDNRPQILVTDYVTPPLAEKLKAMNTQFADTAGNAYLRLPGTLIWVTGRKPVAQTFTDRVPRAFQPTGIKVLFALICLPELAAAPYREIADKTRTALGTINWVMRDLHEMGYLNVAKRNRRLNATKRMLDEWALAYARTLRPKLLLGRYRAPAFTDWQQWQPEKHEALWGGETAGALLTQQLRPGILTLYAKQIPGRMLAELKLINVPDRQATDALVEFRTKFWDFDVIQTVPNIVPAALVYADLLAAGDARCIETARHIYDSHLARLFAER
jgi:hypothetical protein